MTLALKVDAIENIQKYRFFKGFRGMSRGKMTDRGKVVFTTAELIHHACDCLKGGSINYHRKVFYVSLFTFCHLVASFWFNLLVRSVV